MRATSLLSAAVVWLLGIAASAPTLGDEPFRDPRPVTIDLKSAEPMDAFLKVCKAAGVECVIALPKSGGKRVSLSVSRRPLSEVLERIIGQAKYPEALTVLRSFSQVVVRPSFSNFAEAQISHLHYGWSFDGEMIRPALKTLLTVSGHNFVLDNSIQGCFVSEGKADSLEECLNRWCDIVKPVMKKRLEDAVWVFTAREEEPFYPPLRFKDTELYFALRRTCEERGESCVIRSDFFRGITVSGMPDTSSQNDSFKRTLRTLGVGLTAEALYFQQIHIVRPYASTAGDMPKVTMRATLSYARYLLEAIVQSTHCNARFEGDEGLWGQSVSVLIQDRPVEEALDIVLASMMGKQKWRREGSNYVFSAQQ